MAQHDSAAGTRRRLKRVVVRFLQGDTKIFNSFRTEIFVEVLSLCANERVDGSPDDVVAAFPLAAIAGWWFETSVALSLKGK
jgi:hypothetical protein